VVEGTLEVAKDALHSHKMGFKWVMHVEAHLLYHVGDVRPDEGEILESPDQNVVGDRVIDGGAQVIGDLGLSIDQSGAGLVVSHANELKNVPSILALVKEEVVGPAPLRHIFMQVLVHKLCSRNVAHLPHLRIELRGHF
jgi:hypothetical protein